MRALIDPSRTESGDLTATRDRDTVEIGPAGVGAPHTVVPLPGQGRRGKRGTLGLDATVDEVVANAAQTVPRRDGRRLDIVENAACHIECRELDGEALARQRLSEGVVVLGDIDAHLLDRVPSSRGA